MRSRNSRTPTLMVLMAIYSSTRAYLGVRFRKLEEGWSLTGLGTGLGATRKRKMAPIFL
jgi:hypothetical protein